MGKKDKKGKAHEVAPAGEQDGDDAEHSGGLLFGSSLDTRIRPLLDAVDSIRNLLQGASLNITLPSIVVAGDQSAGKVGCKEGVWRGGKGGGGGVRRDERKKKTGKGC